MKNLEQKYDEVIYLSDNYQIFISLETLIDLYVNDKELYINKYYGKIYCPECYKAKLNLIHIKDNKFCLRAFPYQKHTNFCSKQIPLINNSIFKEYCESANSGEQINKRLHQLINIALKKDKIDFNPYVIKIIDKKCCDDEISSKNITHHTGLKSIPTKSLTTLFDEDDYNTWKFFYGKVDIEWHKTNYYYNLMCYHTKKKYLICRISISNKIYEYYLPDKYKEDKKNTFLAFAGKINHDEYSGKFYNNVFLRFSNYLVIE